MEVEYKERDDQHTYNKHFFRYSQEFQCPKLDRSFSDIPFLVMLIFLFCWLAALPVYCTIFSYSAALQRNSTIQGILNQDFRGDICSLNHVTRPYLQWIPQISAAACVADCNNPSLCLYKPDGVSTYTDWCYQLNITSAQPLYGACESAYSIIAQPQAIGEELSKVLLV